MKIGNVELENNIILAPMAGVSDLPFRLLCREQGAGMVCTEMVSAKAISFHNKNTVALLETSPAEHPVSLQLFGADPDIISEMAAYIEERDFDVLDLNMGCPVPKVAGNGEGSALMRNPKLVEQIVSKTVRAIKKPVTVKIRKGFTASEVNAVEIARIAEASGAAAVAVHGRTREQYYTGTADWDIIRQVKEAVSIPVIGNGDVDSAGKAKQLLDETGCDGVMVGRGARGNPVDIPGDPGLSGNRRAAAASIEGRSPRYDAAAHTYGNRVQRGIYRYPGNAQTHFLVHGGLPEFRKAAGLYQ